MQGDNVDTVLSGDWFGKERKSFFFLADQLKKNFLWFSWVKLI